MPHKAYDYAIQGSTPFAMLLAGLLASAHGKNVCLIGEAWSPYRLPRHLDVSVSLATRPETWALLRRESDEVLKLLASIGRGLFERADPLFIAETQPNIDRLGHMRWTSAAFGFAGERAVDPNITASGAITRIRDAAMLITGRAEPALEAWLDTLGVVRLAETATTLTTKRDGTATVTTDGRDIDIATLVLADDRAILETQTASDRHRLLTIVPSTAVIAEPLGRSLPAALCYFIDRDLVLHQRGPKSPLSALTHGAPETAHARLGASMMGPGPLRPTGQALFRKIETLDGAPLIGRSGRHKVTVIAGLGDSAAFVAPAVARLLAEAATDEEQAYFRPRDVSKAAHRQSVAERDPATAEAAA